MIGLLSYNGDSNTNRLIEWLAYYKCDFVRVNIDDEDFRNIRVHIDRGHVATSLKLKNGSWFNLSEFAYFYTRGKCFKKLPRVKNTTAMPTAVFNRYMQNEYDSLTKFFYAEVNRRSVGIFYTDAHIKLSQLALAIEVGLPVCATLITNNRMDVQEQFGSNCLITKAIEDNVGTIYRNRLVGQRVQRIDAYSIEDEFFPSLFQPEVEKDFEVRTFYLAGRTYSIRFKAPNTESVDMRDSYGVMDYEAYVLDHSIQAKVKRLMDGLNLISGSLDFIVGKDGVTYFLEVNPNGQYDWVSQYGGYDLHKEIAQFLMHRNNNHRMS